MKRLMDLHTHTIYSDGVLTVDELIDRAIKNNVDVVSVDSFIFSTLKKNIENALSRLEVEPYFVMIQKEFRNF